MRSATRFLLALLAVVVIDSLPSDADAIAVDLELVLAVDVSGSVSEAEFLLQRNGLASAFQSAAIVTAIQDGALGSIAATLVYWSAAISQQQSVGWTLITNAPTANAFAAAITAALRPFGNETSISEALDFSVPLFNNNFEGTRLVIDVSGDGKNNDDDNPACMGSTDLDCVTVLQSSRNAAVAAGIAINGIAIVADTEFPDLLPYFQANVIGGPDAFAVGATSFEDFQVAIVDKLEREIRGVPIPEPGTVMLVGSGLVAIGWLARRRRYIG